MGEMQTVLQQLTGCGCSAHFADFLNLFESVSLSALCAHHLALAASSAHAISAILAGCITAARNKKIKSAAAAAKVKQINSR